jgi:hypothetical protein
MEQQSPSSTGQRYGPPAVPPPPAPVPFGDGPGETLTAEVASRILRAARRDKPAWFKRWLADAMVPDTPNGAGPGK